MGTSTAQLRTRLALFCLLLGASLARRNATSTNGGYSFTRPRVRDSDSAALARGYRDPDGVLVHESLREVPDSQWDSGLLGRLQCWRSTKSGGRRRCETAKLCGIICEPVLLRVSKPCTMPTAAAAAGKQRWCASARKYLRCFPKLCFDRVDAHRRRISVRKPLVDRRAVAILRWRRPPPRYERDARRNRQSAPQSAIFR